MMTPEALAILCQLRLDGLGEATARAVMADVGAALDLIGRQLASRTGAEDEAFRYDRYAALRTQLVVLRDALQDKIGGRLDDALEATVTATRTAMAREIAAAVPVAANVSFSFAMLPLEQLLAVRDVPYDGFSWTRWGQRLADGVLSRVESELRQGLALGEPTRDVTKRLAGVADLSRTSAQRLARTAITATQNRARMMQWQAPNTRRFADGWRFSSVLDSRVSAVCASLHGKVFGLDDPDAPVPPRHPHCRSTMTLVWKSGQGSRFDRAYYEKQGTGEDWLRTLPEATQREILGATRFRAFQRGVPLSGTVTYDRPLTATELRALYSEEVPS